MRLDVGGAGGVGRKPPRISSRWLQPTVLNHDGRTLEHFRAENDADAFRCPRALEPVFTKQARDIARKNLLAGNAAREARRRQIVDCRLGRTVRSVKDIPGNTVRIGAVDRRAADGRSVGTGDDVVPSPETPLPGLYLVGDTSAGSPKP